MSSLPLSRRAVGIGVGAAAAAVAAAYATQSTVFAERTDDADPTTPSVVLSAALKVPAGAPPNYSHPALKKEAEGPCGNEFKAAFECFHWSSSHPKGRECSEQFKTLKACVYDEDVKTWSSKTQKPYAYHETSMRDKPTGEGLPPPGVHVRRVRRGWEDEKVNRVRQIEENAAADRARRV